MTYLPGEIWHMICTQLWHQRDFNTLFKCACAWKQLASIALPTLYRMHDEGPDEDETAHGKVGRMEYHVKKLKKEVGVNKNRLSQEERILKQSAGFWRTIILSSLGKTLYPYSQYIRRLNLGNLEELLTDSNFTASTSEDFFRGELAQFDNGRPLLGVLDTINRIGEAITKQTPLLEELTGKVRGRELSQWIRRLPRLTHLKPCLGQALLNHAYCITLHCPSFKRLDLWDWDYRYVDLGREAFPVDLNLAACLNQLRPQSLESFGAFNNHYVGPNSFQALSSSHGESLVELRLNKLPALTIQDLWLLKGCTNLVSLLLAGGAECGTDIIKKCQKDALLKTVAWLKECKKLRILSITDILKAHAMVAPILLENDIQLTSLQYEHDGSSNYEIFFKALPNHTSLQYLEMTGIDFEEEEADRLVESLSKLVNLTDLCLGESANSLNDRHVVRLARSLPKLEEWSTGGYKLTDAIWSPLASLRSLRSLNLGENPNFTAYGILDFVEKLGPGNKGLVLAVMYEDPDNSGFSLQEQELIREIIAEKVKGSPGRKTELDSDEITIEFDSDESESEFD